MPRSFTVTKIVLLPKKENPLSWSDYRPISLCNVMNKIISKIIATRLAPLLPYLTTPNQSGFIKGRLLSDNVLLAQELIQDISNCSLTPNVAIKLDMAKAYDRVQWPFLIKVLRRMGFSATWISLIDRCTNFVGFRSSLMVLPRDSSNLQGGLDKVILFLHLFSFLLPTTCRGVWII